MSTKSFFDTIKAIRTNKEIDKVLAGNAASYLDAGIHEVTIQAVETDKIYASGFFKVTMADSTGKQHNESVFLENREKTDLNIGFRKFLAALFGKADKESLDVMDKLFGEFANANMESLKMFTGMKLRVELSPGKGYTVHVTGNQGYAAYEDGQVLTDEYTTMKEAREAAEAKGLKRSFNRAWKMECVDAEHNIAAFNTAYEASKKPAKASPLGKSTIGSPLNRVTSIK
jgi:hypothetical protein